MKLRSLIFAPLALTLAISSTSFAETVKEAPQYVSEAKLPEGWPAPGPYGEVAMKEYPVYRAAYTGGQGDTRSFWTLFRHIQKKDIPMTSPVEMEMQDTDDGMEMTTMGFLYQNTEVGDEGLDGDKIKVMDVAPMKVLSYAWMGGNEEKGREKAKEILDAELKKKGLTAKGFRALGYNGPGTPKAKRTYELQAILEE